MSVRRGNAAGTDQRSGSESEPDASTATLVTSWTTKVIEANKAALDLLGVREPQLVGKPLAVFVDLVDRTAFRNRLRAVPMDGGCEDWHLSLRRPDGTPRAVIASVAPATQDHAGDGRSNLRWSLRVDTNAVPKVLQQDVDELIRKLAHDLNQPLAAIVSYARGCIMRIRSKTLTDEDLEMVLEQVVAEALRAGAIIRELRRKDAP
jgi:signal transduction histidine kinase